MIAEVIALLDPTYAFSPLYKNSRVRADFGEDAAVIEVEDSDKALLLAADGIMEPLLRADPYWAGYCAVLVNVNDIAAMGGMPLAMVNVISLSGDEAKDLCTELMRGVRAGTTKFGVPMVGGHVHPDCGYNAIDVAVLGIADRNSVIYSNTAEEGDDIIFAMDLDGAVHPRAQFSWDSTSFKSSEKIRAQMEVMKVIGDKNLVSAGKDLSNPGSLGTLGMLLETSGKGALVDLRQIPAPPQDVISFDHWLKMYQGCGFVVTSNTENSGEIIKLFEAVGLSAAIVGSIDASNKLYITDGRTTKLLFDFDKDRITGVKGCIYKNYQKER
jgi:hypothetical protein